MKDPDERSTVSCAFEFLECAGSEGISKQPPNSTREKYVAADSGTPPIDELPK